MKPKKEAEMGKKNLKRILLVLFLFFGGTFFNISYLWTEEKLPNSIKDTFEEIRISFHGMWSGPDSPSVMNSSLKRIEPKTQIIIDYARTSDENLKLCANYILNYFDNFIEKFQPGEKIEEKLLKKMKEGILVTEAPTIGLSIYTYLLLELSNIKQDTVFTKEVLSKIYNVCLATSNIFEQFAIYKNPTDLRKKEIEVLKEKEEMMGTSEIFEIAWFCENFMAEAYLSEKTYLPKPAIEIINSYWDWRKEEMIKLKRATCLTIGYYSQTLSYIKKLIEVLPEK
ncbi:MAG: hypothetical protein PHO31_02295 [Candidatus Pacebacteria bacterium]|nr:hypothetical protein [Candidatus Paceibacterota bacterium]